MTTVSNVQSTTAAKPQATSGSSNALPNALSGKGTTNNNSTSSTQQTTSQTPKLDELKKLCAKFKLNLKELCGYTLEELDEEKSEKCLNFIKSFIKADTNEFDTEKLNKYNELKSYLAEAGLTFEEISIATVDKLSAKNLEDIKGAVELAKKQANDKNEVIKLAKKYITVLVCGSYTLKELQDKYEENLKNDKVKDKDPLKGEGISQRIERFFSGELNGKKFSELSPEEQKKFIERYFNGYFKKLLAENKNNPEKVYRLQMRDFAKLLANTPDEEKGIFRDAISSLLSENRLKGIFATKQSFLNQEALTNWANGWSVEQQAALGKVDQFGNKPSSDEVVAMDASILQEQDEAGRAKSHKEMYDRIQEIEKKIANNEELTKEEQLIYDLHQELLAGDKLGTATNTVCSEEWIKKFSKKIDAELYNTFGEETYRKVLEQVKTTIEAHSEITSMPKEDLTALLDEVTNGNYSIVANGSDKPLNAPKTEETETAAETIVVPVQTDRVVEQKTTQEQAQKASERVQRISAQIAPASNESFTVLNSSTVASSDSSKLSAKEVAKLENDAVKNGKIEKYLKATGTTMYQFATKRVTDWHNTGKNTQDKIVDYAGRALYSTQVALGMLASNSMECFKALAKEVDFKNMTITLNHEQKKIVEDVA